MMLSSIVFLISEVYLFVGILRLKKSDSPLPFMTWIPLAIIAQMCFHAFVAGIMSLVRIPISLFTVGCFDFVVAVVLQKLYRKNRQSYQVNKKDLMFLTAFSIGVIAFGIVFFGSQFQIHYWSVDGSAHFAMAQHVVQEHEFNNNLYFSALNNGLAMLFFEPFFGADLNYKVFLAMSLFDLWVSGTLFYSVIRFLYPHQSVFSGIIVSALYVLGYPLYAVIFGFSYFGMSISVILFCLLIQEMKMKDKIDDNQYLILMDLGLFSLFVCYSYFVPVVFLAIFCVVFWKHRCDTGKWLDLSLVKKESALFVLPCVLGLLFSFTNLKELGAGGGITNEGGCYFQLYQDFVFILIPAVLGFVISIKNRKNVSIIMTGVFSFLFLIALLIMKMNGRASTYYVSKIYNLIWFVAFVFAVEGFEFVKEKSRMVSITVYGLFVVLFFINLQFMNIYVMNFISKNNPYVTDDKIQTFQKIRDQYGNDEKDNFFAIGSEMDCSWFKAISGQKLSESYDFSRFVNQMEDEEVAYLYCMDSGITQENFEALMSMGDVIEKDPVGIIIEIQREND